MAPVGSEKEKKRKRHSTDADKAVKKRSVDAGQGEIKVVHTSSKGRLCPAIASVPGIQLKPQSFVAYSKPLKRDGAAILPAPSSHSLLLHSSAHPYLDHTASDGTDQTQKHFLGVFDPASNTLQVVPAHSVNLRTTLRSENNEVEASNAQRTKAMQREALGMEFGTKKAKRSLASKTINAITTATGKGVESAVLGIVNDTSSALPDKIEREAEILKSKPIPQPNLETEKIEEVYAIDKLVPSGDMRAMVVKEWQDKIKEGTAIEFTSRFVANRVQALAKMEDVTKLKALKYMLLLLDFTAALKPAGKAGKKVPQRDELKEKLAMWPETSVEHVRRRFADGGEVNKWRYDNLMTHMAAICLFIDDFKTDTHDLREDLRLDNRQMAQYFHELGCRIRSPTDKEHAEFRISKSQAAQRKVAVLKLPLEFPKTRIPPKRR
ncbi:hypothetical protein ANO11243_048930 [Dothideomycetidae sp. 11243]|nr:hypothetical protein ANO11243_048930 [fungal sp. No.11243]